MYRVTITMKTNGSTIETEQRKLARAVYELSIEHPNELEVTVVKLATPKQVKFKNL